METSKQLWQTIRESHQHLPTDFTCLQFGNTPEMAEELAALVMSGEKTATSSLVQLAFSLKRRLSEVGDCYLLVGHNQESLAFLEVTQTEVRQFGAITHQFAEDEGDGTLENWLEIHQAYYSHQLLGLDKTLEPETELHCEWFKVIYDLRKEE